MPKSNPGTGERMDVGILASYETVGNLAGLLNAAGQDIPCAVGIQFRLGSERYSEVFAVPLERVEKLADGLRKLVAQARELGWEG